MPGFADRLAEALDRAGSVACVGLDPVEDQMPAEVRSRHHEPLAGLAEFCRGVIDAVAGVVAVVKPQSACFERYGSRGVEVLERTVGHAKERGLVVLLDAKRGDIGVSARHYAAGARHLGADAITLHGYLGPSSVEPYLAEGLGVFVLVRTSNPDSDAVQSPELRDGRQVCAMMADHVAALGHGRRGASGLSDVGAVVGATKSADAAMLRARMPDQVFLVPGYGAQGGTPDDVRAMRRPGTATPGRGGVLVTASRSVIYAGGTDDWRANVRSAAQKLVAELKTIQEP